MQFRDALSLFRSTFLQQAGAGQIPAPTTVNSYRCVEPGLEPGQHSVRALIKPRFTQ